MRFLERVRKAQRAKGVKAIEDAIESGIDRAIKRTVQKVSPSLVKEVQTLQSRGLTQVAIGKAVGRSRGSVAGILYRLRNALPEAPTTRAPSELIGVAITLTTEEVRVLETLMKRIKGQK